MAKRGGFPGMGMPGNMNNLMKQAQKMQRQMEEKQKELEEKLEAYRSSLSEEQLDAMVEKTKALEAYQEAGEDPKALECIPMLKRSDIKREAAKIINEELTVDDSLFLYHDVCTNGIGYVDLMFKTDSIAPEQIPYLGLLKSVLGLSLIHISEPTRH